MSYRYFIVEETRQTLTKTEYITYGISLKCDGTILTTVSDISSNFTVVKELTDLCNRLKLDPSQLKEVAEDILDTMPKPE